MTNSNLHLFLSNIEHETRLVKEARATLSMGVFSRVRVLGLWDKGLPLTETHSSGLEVIRVRTAPRLVKEFFPLLRRGVVTKALGLIGLVQYALAAVWEALKVRPSHVSCHNLLLLPVGWLAARITGSKLVYVPHELETERTGLSGWMKRLAMPIERSFIHSCSAVVVVCEPIADWYRQRYGLANVHVVRAIPETAFGGMADPALRARIRESHGVPEEALLFIYQGVLAIERGVDELLSRFCELDSRFHLMLMGYGEAVDRIKSVAATCSHVHYQPAVSVDQIIHYSGAADVGVFIVNDPLALSYQLSLPNKFFEYQYAGLPIIVSENLKFLSKIVGDEGIGWTIDSPRELGQLIRSLDRGAVERLRLAVIRYASRNTWDAERLRYKSVYTGY